MTAAREATPSRRIADILSAEIRNERIAPATLLPTVRELSIRFGVDGATIRKALELLRGDGYVEPGPAGRMRASRYNMPWLHLSCDRITSATAPLSDAAATIGPMIDETAYAPLVLSEYDHEPESYYLMLTDAAMVAVEDEFEACGRYGNGYGWEGVARSAVRAHAPEEADHLTYGSEAGMFVARSHDLDALRRLAALLSQAFHDRTQLAELIRSGDPDEFD